MAALQGDLINDLKVAVECAICLDTLVEPKCLQCNHSYCKSCLDGILKFTPIGSAVIKCPKGCSETTWIPVSQTTNDLRFDSVVKDVLGIVSKFSKNDDPAKSGYCCKKVVKHCGTCEMFMCAECDQHVLHDDNETYFNYNIHYNVKQEEFTMCCITHEIDVDSICSCGVGLCIYCRHRQHRWHCTKKLDEVESLLKHEIRENIEAKKNIKARLNEIKQQITSAKFELETHLSKQMIKRLADYATFLKEEAELIKQNFSDITKEHYEGIKTLDNDEYFESWLLKTGTRFILQKDRLRSMLDSNTVSEISISLCDSTFKEEHPLGVLKYDKGCHLFPLKSFDPANTFKSKFPKVDPVSASVSYLKKFLGCPFKMENKYCKKRKNSREVKPKTKVAKKQIPCDDDQDDGDRQSQYEVLHFHQKRRMCRKILHDIMKHKGFLAFYCPS